MIAILKFRFWFWMFDWTTSLSKFCENKSEEQFKNPDNAEYIEHWIKEIQ